MLISTLLDADGRPSFQALQHRRTSALALVYYAFDLLEVDGVSLLRKSLDERRRRLKALIRGSHLLLSDVLPGCRVEINGAGMAVCTGKKGQKRVGDLSWEKLVERLQAQ